MKSGARVSLVHFEELIVILVIICGSFIDSQQHGKEAKRCDVITGDFETHPSAEWEVSNPGIPERHAQYLAEISEAIGEAPISCPMKKGSTN